MLLIFRKSISEINKSITQSHISVPALSFAEAGRAHQGEDRRSKNHASESKHNCCSRDERIQHLNLLLGHLHVFIDAERVVGPLSQELILALELAHGDAGDPQEVYREENLSDCIRQHVAVVAVVIVAAALPLAVFSAASEKHSDHLPDEKHTQEVDGADPHRFQPVGISIVATIC